jgi:RecB family exonuclease
VDPSSTGSGGEEQPSRFLAELAATPPEAPAEAELAWDTTLSGAAGPATGPDGELAVRPGTLRRPLTLPAIVAELRATVTSGAQPERLRRAAAAKLAKLAAAGVAGADPDEWWGLRPLSDEGALAGPGEDVRVTPSTVESVLRCGLRWLLERNGGSDPPSAKQGIGNLVHAAAMLVDDPSVDPAAVQAYVTERFGQIELPALWLGERERDRAGRMVDKLLSWLAANPREQVAIEAGFERRIEQRPDEPNVFLKGRVDRLERDEHGRLVVVDLKTGAGAPSVNDTLVHPQLAAYQAAVEAGAFAQGSESGGAEIVAIGTSSANATVRVQPPLRESEDPAWAETLVRRAAAAMAAATFVAVVNDSCPYCAVRTSCPLSGKGRQVTG